MSKSIVDPNWRILPGEQMALPLDMPAESPPADPLEGFDREQRAMKLLIELAQSLGELKASSDIESFRRGLVSDREAEPGAHRRPPRP